MKYIHIFLASSITELQRERTELSSYFRLLNDRFIDKGVYFRLHMCEDISDEIAMTRKQDEYNEVIRGSDYFYVIFWKKVGSYTREEFETAFDTFRKKGAPKIVTFFKEVEGDIPDEVMAFLDHLDKELQHFYTVFRNIDSVKLKILLEMIKMPELSSKVELKDADLYIDGDKVTEINLENIPFYAKHEKLQTLRNEIKALDEAFAEAKKASRLDPDNDELWQKCYEISSKRNTALNALHDIEMQLIEMSARLVELSSTGELITWRTKLAIELFEKGDLQGAKDVLNEAEYEADKNRAKAKADLMKKELQALVKERTVKIDIIKAEGVTVENADEIEAIYDDITELFFDYHLEGDVISDFINFLWRQRKVTKAVGIAERLYHYYETKSERSLFDWARVNNRLGVLYSESNRNIDAVSLFLEAIRCQKELAKSGNDEDLAALAITHNNLAVEYALLYRYPEAEEQHIAALTIRRELAKNGNDEHIANLAMTCNNYAIHLRRLNRDSEAEKMHEEALRLRQGLVAKDRQKYLPTLSMSYHNFAIFYHLLENSEKYGAAEKMFLEAIEMRRELAAINPDAYSGALASSLSSFGSFLRRRERYSESVECFSESLAIRRKLVEKDYHAHIRELISVTSTFSFLYEDMEKYDEALALSLEAVALRQKLYEVNPEANAPQMAREYFFVGTVYDKLEDYEKTLEYYMLCYEMRRELYQKSPDTFRKDMESILNFLGYVSEDLNRPEEAQKWFNEAEKIKNQT